jgi:hypothetical protein
MTPANTSTSLTVASKTVTSANVAPEHSEVSKVVRQTQLFLLKCLILTSLKVDAKTRTSLNVAHENKYVLNVALEENGVY